MDHYTGLHFDLRHVSEPETWLKFKNDPLTHPKEVQPTFDCRKKVNDLSVVCYKCKVKSDNPEDHLQHFEHEHKTSKAAFTCLECDKPIANVRTFVLHRFWHETGLIYQCYFCQHITHSGTFHCRHLTQVHKDPGTGQYKLEHLRKMYFNSILDSIPTGID
jgi:hypothetical protein